MFGQIKLLLFLASCPPLIRAVEEHERIAFDSRVNGESGRHMIGWLSRKPLLPVSADLSVRLQGMGSPNRRERLMTPTGSRRRRAVSRDPVSSE
jgi:hypothetical protein